MYAGRVACCPLVRHGEYADGTDRGTDGRKTVTLRFPLEAAGVIVTDDNVTFVIFSPKFVRSSIVASCGFSTAGAEIINTGNQLFLTVTFDHARCRQMSRERK